MKIKFPISFILLMVLVGCVTHEEVDHRSYQNSFDTSAPTPTSLQYAERIDEDRYRIYNVFQMADGTITKLGSIVLSKDEPVDIAGEDSEIIDSVTIILIEAHDDEIIVRSAYSGSDSGTRTSVDSIPLRPSATEQVR